MKGLQKIHERHKIQTLISVQKNLKSMHSMFSYAFFMSFLNTLVWLTLYNNLLDVMWDHCDGVHKNTVLTNFMTLVKITLILQNKLQLKVLKISQETERSHRLVYSPNALKDQAWARLNPGSRSSICVSHMSSRNLTTWVITWCLPGCIFKGCWNQKTETGLECRHSMSTV